MPINRMIGKYDPDLGRVVWSQSEDMPAESIAPAIEGVKHIRAVGLPGQPVFESRKSYEEAVRRAGCVVVGNEGVPDKMLGDRNMNDLIQESQRTQRIKR